MRIIDAPREGWYPDPDGRQRLRWWDGLDWTDIRRAPPSSAELTRAEALVPREPIAADQRAYTDRPQGYSRQETQEIIAEVRTVARQELDRAAEQFSQRATTAVRSFTPLITQYTSKFLRWMKIALGIATVLSSHGCSSRQSQRRALSRGSVTASTASLKTLAAHNCAWGQAPFATL